MLARCALGAGLLLGAGFMVVLLREYGRWS